MLVFQDPLRFDGQSVPHSCRVAFDRLCIDDEPMAKGGKRRFDPVKLGAIAGIEDTARFSFRNTEFFGERDLADSGFAPRAIDGNFRRQLRGQRNEMLAFA
jgi:hypothetical protein